MSVILPASGCTAAVAIKNAVVIHEMLANESNESEMGASSVTSTVPSSAAKNVPI